MRTILLLASAILGACGPSRQAPEAAATEPTLSVEPTTARPGARVTLVLRNGGADAVGYNLCTSGLERRAGDAWVAVPADRVCTMELRTLQPGGEDRYPLELPRDLAPGEYRFQTTLEVMGSGARNPVASGPFQVSS